MISLGPIRNKDNNRTDKDTAKYINRFNISNVGNVDIICRCAKKNDNRINIDDRDIYFINIILYLKCG